MFFRYQDLVEGALAPEKDQRATEIATALPTAEIVTMERRFVTLKTSQGAMIEGDVAPSGFTVYMGGFDWVTFPTPQQVLLHYPELMPLPAQAFRADDDILEGDL